MGAVLCSWWEAGPEGKLAAVCVLPCLLAYMTLGGRLAWVDATSHRLPRKLTLPLYPIGVFSLGTAAVTASEPRRVITALAGAILAWGVFVISRWLGGGALGRGDVVLAPILGWACGFLSVLHAVAWVAFSFIAAGLWAVALLVAGRVRHDAYLPLGPWMFLAAGVVWCIGTS